MPITPLLSSVILFLAPGDSMLVDRDHEQARVQEHLDGALHFLRMAETSQLDASQRSNRELNVARLQWYRDRGSFPENDRFPGASVPSFRDADGVLCAMGFLLWDSGETGLVERIAAERNHWTIHQLASDPGLATWLEENGLSLEEAARIQPTYEHMPRRADQTELRRALAIGSLLLLGLAYFVLSSQSRR